MGNTKSIGIAYSDQDINGGTIDNSAIGGTTPAAGAFTTLTASGATTLNGNVAIGNATSDTVGFYGVTAVAQQASANQVQLTITPTSSGATIFGFATSAIMNSLLNQVEEIRQSLVDLGLLKGSA